MEGCDHVKRRKRRRLEVGKLGKLFSTARRLKQGIFNFGKPANFFARCRTRFVVPALLFEDKVCNINIICSSA